MASVLRQLVASNRVKHQDTGLDLCYVTSNLLATCVSYFSSSTRFISSFLPSSLSSPLFSLVSLGVVCYINPLDLQTSLLGRLPGSLLGFVGRVVSRPRLLHGESGLDLGYITRRVIVTSGPSQTYPRLAYRNPLDKLVSFLDSKHSNNWAIWEFRAEGTGYPDEAVYHRIRHYPWPDHHPPPFALVPLIVASMRDWLLGKELFSTGNEVKDGKEAAPGATAVEGKKDGSDDKKSERVVVVHCKAGKGRSGTMAVSYLISECGWTAEDALARFTERRMRPGYGAGVSIPSQVRWINYVDRWAKVGKKKYVDSPIEIVEIHVWGLRHGVKLSIEGYENEGKKIAVLHTFGRDERIVVEGDAPGGGGVMDLVSDMAGYVIGSKGDDGKDKEDQSESVGSTEYEDSDGNLSSSSARKGIERSGSKKRGKASSLLRKVSKRVPHGLGGDGKGKAKTIAIPETTTTIASQSPIRSAQGSTTTAQSSSTSLPPPQSRPSPPISLADEAEPGGQAVIFKPHTPILVPNSDVNIAIERTNRVKGSKRLAMVTSVAHVWFNAYFEGNGPEKGGNPDDSGVFEIEWDALDGIKGSKQRGTRACDSFSVVWRRASASTGTGEERGDKEGEGVVAEPGKGETVPQMKAADWKGGNEEDPEAGLHLGLKVATGKEEEESEAEASFVDDTDREGNRKGKGKKAEEDDKFLDEGVKVCGPKGEDIIG